MAIFLPIELTTVNIDASGGVRTSVGNAAAKGA